MPGGGNGRLLGPFDDAPGAVAPGVVGPGVARAHTLGTLLRRGSHLRPCADVTVWNAGVMPLPCGCNNRV